MFVKASVGSVPLAAVYQAVDVPNTATYDPPPGNSGNQASTGNNGLRGGQDGPANTRSKIKLPEPTTQQRNLPTINGPQPPPANNGYTLASQAEPLPSITNQFPPPDAANVPGASSYEPPTVPSATEY